MSLYSSFYPAEYAEDVTGLDASALWLAIESRVPAKRQNLAHGEITKNGLSES